MISGVVYRAPSVDTHGDPVGYNGKVTRLGADDTWAGKVDILMGAETVSPTSARGHVVSTAGMVGVRTDSATQLADGDLLALEDGRQLRITGPQQWGRPHSLTGSPARFAWWRATSLHN